jgi:hypothetical protein
MPIREVVSLTQDDHPALASHLEAALGEEREKQIHGLLATKDWPDFEKRRGTINGLTAAISICQQIQERLA